MKKILFLFALILVSIGSLAQSSGSKDKIKNSEASKLIKQANSILLSEPSKSKLALELAENANQLEPENPLILETIFDAKMACKLSPYDALKDLNNAIILSKDKTALQLRYKKRAMTYFNLQNLNSACKDWQNGGELCSEYVTKYCHHFDTIIHENIDSNIVLSLSIDCDTVRVFPLKEYNRMSRCYGNLTIKNNEIQDFQFDKNFVVVLENETYASCYIEAVNVNTKEKFQFYLPPLDMLSQPREIVKLKAGDEFVQRIFVSSGTIMYSSPGTYKIRLAIRPTTEMTGFINTYYSNWQNLVVIENK